MSNWAQVIPDLIQRGAHAQAEARRASGQIWGQTLASLGQIPQQIQQAKTADQERQLRGVELDVRKLQLTSAQREEQQDQQIAAIFAQDPNPAVAIPKVMKVSPKKGMQFQQEYDKTQAEGLQHKEALLKVEAQKAGIIGQILQGSTDQESHVRQLHVMQAAGLPVDEFSGDYEKDKPLIESKKKAALTVKDAADNALQAKTQASLEEHQRKLEQNAADTLKATVADKAADNARLDAEAAARIPLITAQTAEAAARVPLATAQTAEAKARVPLIGAEAAKAALEANQLRQVSAVGASGAATPDVAPGQKNDAFLQALPPQTGAVVKLLAEGRMSFPGGNALRSPYWQGLLQAVAKYDPSFDAVNYNARAKTRADFTSGATSKQVNAINTVIGHLSSLSDAADALKNGNVPLLNSIANRFSQARGKSEVTNFNTIKKAVSDEVTRVWRQAGGTMEDIRAVQQNLDPSGSPEQIHGGIGTYADLLVSKLGSLNEQYRQGMGTDKIDILTPQAQAALTKLGQRAGHAPADTTPASFRVGPYDVKVK